MGVARSGVGERQDTFFVRPFFKSPGKLRYITRPSTRQTHHQASKSGSSTARFSQNLRALRVLRARPVSTSTPIARPALSPPLKICVHL